MIEARWRRGSPVDAQQFFPKAFLPALASVGRYIVDHDPP
jgi:hypothetical protein